MTEEKKVIQIPPQRKTEQAAEYDTSPQGLIYFYSTPLCVVEGFCFG